MSFPLIYTWYYFLYFCPSIKVLTALKNYLVSFRGLDRNRHADEKPPAEIASLHQHTECIYLGNPNIQQYSFFKFRHNVNCTDRLLEGNMHKSCYTMKYNVTRNLVVLLFETSHLRVHFGDGNNVWLHLSDLCSSLCFIVVVYPLP